MRDTAHRGDAGKERICPHHIFDQPHQPVVYIFISLTLRQRMQLFNRCISKTVLCQCMRILPQLFRINNTISLIEKVFKDYFGRLDFDTPLLFSLGKSLAKATRPFDRR